VTVALSDLGDPGTAEPWEGVLITVDETNNVVVSAENDFDEFQLSDGTDDLWVDNFLFSVYDDAGNFPNMGVDAQYESVTGPLNYTFGDFKVAPREAADLAGYVAPVISGASVEDLSAGDLIITEIMFNPAECNDTDCEYIEIYNDSGSNVNLNGLRIEDLAGNTGMVSQDVVIASGEYEILGQTGWAYTTVTPLAEVGLPAFNNNSDEFALIANSSITIDQAATYTPLAGQADAGYALKFDSTVPDATENDDIMNWCYAPNTFEGNDYGSPGAPNNMGCSNPM
jgi:hypothetical protein